MSDKLTTRRKMFVFVVHDVMNKTFIDELLRYFDLDIEQTAFVQHENDDVTKQQINIVNPDLVVFYECPSCLTQNDDLKFIVCGSSHPNGQEPEQVRKTVERYALTDFPHLHLHDEFSLRDGVGTAEQRAQLLRERRWTYLTASNHGSLGGWIKQYVLARKHGFKPVFGVEAYVNRFRRFTRDEAKNFDDEMKLKYRKNAHLLLLARNTTGWFNIIKMHNDAQLNGFYYVPRTDDDFLSQHGEGVIATSTDGGAGEIPRLLVDESLPWEQRLQLARAKYEFYKEVFDDFYIELNLLRWDKQAEVNRALITFGEWIKAKYVITCDCHYLRPEDAATHDVLLMIRDNKTMADKAMMYASSRLNELLREHNKAADEETIAQDSPFIQEALEFGRKYLKRDNLTFALNEFEEKVASIGRGETVLDPNKEDSVWEFNVKDLYAKDLDEIYSTWCDLHGPNDSVFTEEVFWRAVRGTRQLVRSVENFNVDTSVKLPRTTENPDQRLRDLCYEGLRTKGLDQRTEYRERLDYELSVISSKNFSDYFLVFHEIMQFCREHGIMTGPGRGSCAGCLLSYCLEITQVDPLRYNLLFERFMDPERTDPPDIDLDFDLRRRQEVKTGMAQRFGEQHVCSVGSYQVMRTRAVIKDVGRVYCMPAGFLNGITKRLANTYGENEDEEGEKIGIDKVDWNALVAQEPTLQQLFAENPYVQQHCKTLRGQVRNIGKHPAGMIVSSVNLFDWIPVRKEDDELVACWTEGLDLKELQSVGLVKYDILGLRTVGILSDVIDLVQRTVKCLVFQDGSRLRIAAAEIVYVEHEGSLYSVRVKDLQPGHVVTRLPRKTIKLNDGDELVSYEETKTELVDCGSKVVTTLENAPLNPVDFSTEDSASLHRLNECDVFGVFQFETPVATQVIQEIGIDAFMDMCAATALGRPDPLSGRLHQIYGRRKRGEERWESVPIIADALDETFGLPVYQETSMIMSQRLAGFSAGEANLLRKGLAKGKDNEENMKKLQNLLTEFSQRAQTAVERGDITKKQLDKFVRILERFGGYGFNKSHSLSYAMLGYWTLFLKTHYPTQFMCVLFNFTERTKTDRSGTSALSRYVKYCRKRGIEVLPPDVNESGDGFTLISPTRVRWGLSRVKNLSSTVAAELTSKQPFTSLEDLCERVEKRKVNKTKITTLIKCGALDCFGDREYLLNKYFGVVRKEKNFEGLSFPQKEREQAEQELLGLCLSKRVMPQLDPSWLEQNKIQRLEELPNRSRGVFIGRVKNVKERQSSRSGKNMLVVSLHDDTDETSFFVWERDIPTCVSVLQPSKLVTVPLKKFDDGGACFYSGPDDLLIALEEESRS